jgi:hypothetical protein
MISKFPPDFRPFFPESQSIEQKPTTQWLVDCFFGTAFQQPGRCKNPEKLTLAGWGSAITICW